MIWSKFLMKTMEIVSILVVANLDYSTMSIARNNSLNFSFSNHQNLGWYPGLVVAANADEYEYEVNIGDEEIKLYDPLYIRPYQHFNEGDIIEVLVSSNDDDDEANEERVDDDGEYFPARVTRVAKNKNSFVTVIFENDTDPMSVPISIIRRDCYSSKK